jgi:hypothetical protein
MWLTRERSETRSPGLPSQAKPKTSLGNLLMKHRASDPVALPDFTAIHRPHEETALNRFHISLHPWMWPLFLPPLPFQIIDHPIKILTSYSNATARAKHINGSVLLSQSIRISLIICACNSLRGIDHGCHQILKGTVNDRL